MKEDIARLTEKLDRLRVDLAATNLALLAISSALTPEQMKHALATMAAASAEKQATFERLPTPAVEAATKQMQAAEQRVFAMLQAGAARYGRGEQA